MNRIKWKSDKWIAVCHVLCAVGCGGSATDQVQGDAEDDANDGTSSSTDPGSFSDPSNNGSQVCGDVAYPVVSVLITNAPGQDGQCLASLELQWSTGTSQGECWASGSDCVCTIWNGALVDGQSVLTVIDENGVPSTTYSGPYDPPTGTSCGDVTYASIELEYALGALEPGEQTSCDRSGIVEYCSVGQTCCTCGCGERTESCFHEAVCPPHDGPICGEAQCRAGTICCDAIQGFCAATQEDCPE